MTRPHLVRRVPRYPKRFLPVKVGDARLGGRRVPVRPARFVVGLEEHEAPWPPEVRSAMGEAALRAATYLGRVEEIGPAGELTVTAWETPSGREGVTTLFAHDRVTGATGMNEDPQVGDLLRIWTWIELRKDGAQLARVVFEVAPSAPNEEALEQLEGIIAALKEGSR